MILLKDLLNTLYKFLRSKFACALVPTWQRSRLENYLSLGFLVRYLDLGAWTQAKPLIRILSFMHSIHSAEQYFFVVEITQYLLLVKLGCAALLFCRLF